mmetsp:Transcript_8706/g.10199  ORF Transcript_8706/g.10199 Transcript_8706/m.10199 type:complete len:180 (-) Transcript_8706:251-790(-)
MMSDARLCKVESSVPTKRDIHMNDVEIKIPLLIANSSCTASEKKSFCITMLLLSLPPIVVLHRRKPGNNSVRSKAPATSFCETYRMRCTGIYPANSRPTKSPILKTTKLKGTYRSLSSRLYRFSHAWLLLSSETQDGNRESVRENVKKMQAAGPLMTGRRDVGRPVLSGSISSSSAVSS